MDMSSVKPVWRKVERVGPLTIITSSFLSEGEIRLKVESREKRQVAAARKKAKRKVLSKYPAEAVREGFVKMKHCGHVFCEEEVKNYHKNCPTCKQAFGKKLEYNKEENMWFEY